MNKSYEIITALCKDRGITYNYMCKQLDISPSTIGNLKSNPDRVLNAKYAAMIANYLGVTVNYILYGEEKEKTATSGDDLNNLSEKDKRFIEWFRSLSEEKQKAILISQDAPADLF